MYCGGVDEPSEREILEAENKMLREKLGRACEVNDELNRAIEGHVDETVKYVSGMYNKPDVRLAGDHPDGVEEVEIRLTPIRCSVRLAPRVQFGNWSKHHREAYVRLMAQDFGDRVSNLLHELLFMGYAIENGATND